jgi:AraC-like DNA-binding protein
MPVLEIHESAVPQKSACAMSMHRSGMTVSELITSMRINLAEQIFLNNPGISVTECALAAGFSDSSYFIKQFRRHKGMSPKSLLKMLGQV